MAHATGPASRPTSEWQTILGFAHAANQSCAALGVIGWSIAAILFSIALMKMSTSHVFVGVLGILVGALPAGAMPLGHLALNVKGFMIFVVAQALWHLLIGVWLVRGKI